MLIGFGFGQITFSGKGEVVAVRLFKLKDNIVSKILRNLQWKNIIQVLIELFQA